MENVIDFAGHTGYVDTAVAASAIVPMVSIGGRETQFYLSRDACMAGAGAPDSTSWNAGLLRTDILPVLVQVPLRPQCAHPGEHAAAVEDRLRVLDPIGVVRQWGRTRFREVDGRIRRLMQGDAGPAGPTAPAADHHRLSRSTGPGHLLEQ